MLFFKKNIYLSIAIVQLCSVLFSHATIILQNRTHTTLVINGLAIAKNESYSLDYNNYNTFNPDEISIIVPEYYQEPIGSSNTLPLSSENCFCFSIDTHQLNDATYNIYLQVERLSSPSTCSFLFYFNEYCCNELPAIYNNFTLFDTIPQNTHLDDEQASLLHVQLIDEENGSIIESERVKMPRSCHLPDDEEAKYATISINCVPDNVPNTIAQRFIVTFKNNLTGQLSHRLIIIPESTQSKATHPISNGLLEWLKNPANIIPSLIYKTDPLHSFPTDFYQDILEYANIKTVQYNANTGLKLFAYKYDGTNTTPTLWSYDDEGNETSECTDCIEQDIAGIYLQFNTPCYYFNLDTISSSPLQGYTGTLEFGINIGAAGNAPRLGFTVSHKLFKPEKRKPNIKLSLNQADAATINTLINTMNLTPKKRRSNNQSSTRSREFSRSKKRQSKLKNCKPLAFPDLDTLQP